MTKKFLVLADIDGTVCPNPPIMFLLAEYQSTTGTLRPGYLEQLRKHWRVYEKGGLSYVTFAEKLLILYAASIKGTMLSKVLQEARDLINQGFLVFYPSISQLLKKLQKTHDLYFITASPQFIAQAVSENFPGSYFLSTGFDVKKGVLTGKVGKSLVNKKIKQSIIKNLVREYPRENSYAFGDTESDELMLDCVSNPVCINPNKELRRLAKLKGYEIIATPL